MTNNYGRTSAFHITTKEKEGKTYIDDIYVAAPLKMTRPFPQENGGIQVIMMSSAPGIMDGDVHDIIINTLDNSKLWVTSQSFEKIYKTTETKSLRNTKIKVGKNAYLKYAPQPTTPFTESSFKATTEVELEDESSKFAMVEIITCGRATMGEKFQYTKYETLVDIRTKGEMIYRDNCVFVPEEFPMEGFGMYEGYTHLANLLLYNFNVDEDILTKIRGTIKEKGFDGGATLSYTNDVAIRVYGRNGQELMDLSDDIIEIVEEFTGSKFKS